MFGFGRKKKGGRSDNRLRILFATDLHAGERTFRKFLNAAPVYEANVLILGGDLTGKLVAPIVETDGVFRATQMGELVESSAEDLPDLERSFRDLGFYPVQLSQEEYDRFSSDEGYREQVVEDLLHDQVRSWMELAAERLGDSGIPMFVTGGNDDPMSIEAVLSDAEYATNAESTVVDLGGGHQMASTGYGNQTPWPCPRDITEEELGEKIDAAIEGIGEMSSAIFNFHVPPYDSSLDIAPKLDESVSPPAVIPGETAPVGSHSVRAAIERHQPMLSLHGHIHESRGIVNIGRTVCVNPGSEYAEGVLRAAVIDISGGEVINAQLVAG